MELDAADRQILAILQEDSRSSLDNLAIDTGLSAATVQRRIKRMRDVGIIEKDVVVLESTSLGWNMTFIVLVEMERERVHVLDEFKRKMRKEKQVQQCYYITGDADFALICYARDMSDYEELTRRLFFDDANVRRFRTSVVMSSVKRSLAVDTE